MNCIIAQHAGFCPGVAHTINTIESLLAKKEDRIFCIGLPVHNPQVTERLIAQGLEVVDSIDAIPSGTLVVRAHGLAPHIITAAKAKSLTVVNTTCTFVMKAQELAQQLTRDGYHVVITGERNHPEVQGLFGYTNDQGTICSSVSACRELSRFPKIGIVSQTTFSEPLFKEIVASVEKQAAGEVKVFNTICHSIERRNTAAREVARTVDVMLIIGGKMSSNTKRLYEACKEVNPHSFHVESSDDLFDGWFHTVSSVGLAAGASTPQWLIEQIKKTVETYY